MGIFDLFKKKRNDLIEDNLKWNKMWDLWVEGNIESSYAELMMYYDEINNGGHCQYFTNIENNGNLKKEIGLVLETLSLELKNNLNNAYRAYLNLEKNECVFDSEVILEQCDNIFYENEEEIEKYLKEFASKIEL